MLESKMKELIKILKTGSHNVHDLQCFFGVSTRTVRRWLEEVEARGYRIVREGVYPMSPYGILSKKRK